MGGGFRIPISLRALRRRLRGLEERLPIEKATKDRRLFPPAANMVAGAEDTPCRRNDVPSTATV
jgi:hypothetical protein